MRPVTLGTSVISIELASTDALPTRLLLPDELVWLELAPLVRSITPGLCLTLATSAPEVCLALFHLDFVAASLRHIWQD